MGKIKNQTKESECDRGLTSHRSPHFNNADITNESHIREKEGGKMMERGARRKTKEKKWILFHSRGLKKVDVGKRVRSGRKLLQKKS